MKQYKLKPIEWEYFPKKKCSPVLTTDVWDFTNPLCIGRIQRRLEGSMSLNYRYWDFESFKWICVGSLQTAKKGVERIYVKMLKKHHFIY